MAELNNFIEGMRKYRSGRYDEAIGLLIPLIDRDDLPGRIARYYAGMSHRCAGVDLMRQHQYEEAALRLRQALAYLGGKADLAEYLCTVYARTGRRDQSLDQAETLAEAHPNEEATQLRLAQAQFRCGKTPLAILTLCHALRTLGDSAAVHRNLGLLYAQQEEYGQARDHLAEACECDPADAPAWRTLGMAESMLDHFHAAADALQRAYTLQPSDVLLAYQLCLAADASNKAGERFVIALGGPATAPDASQVRQLADYVAAEPDFVDAFLAMPASQADEELFGLLSTVLKTALADHENYADLHHHASRTLWRLHDADGAALHARSAIRINPRYKDALVHLALLEESQGQSAEAVEHLRQAVDSGADWADVHLHLGGLYHKQGRDQAAVGHYRRALELNGRCAEAQEQLARLAA